jgi:hypothetical protein
MYKVQELTEWISTVFPDRQKLFHIQFETDKVVITENTYCHKDNYARCNTFYVQVSDNMISEC